MTADEVTVRTNRSTGTVPGPRTTGSPAVVGDGDPLRSRPGRRSRPREEYWDVATARWVTRSPVPAPRRS